MGIIEILLIGIGLSMDACAVSMTDGMCYRGLKKIQALYIAIAFGLFQGIMPLIGFYAGSLFAEQISGFDHWIALALLSVIGGKMIWDGFHHANGECSLKPFSFGILLVQAIATSIDALAVGVSFAAAKVDIYAAVSVIAATTFIISIVAIYIGKKIGDKLNSKAEIFGGTILVIIGIKIFVEHMFF